MPLSRAFERLVNHVSDHDLYEAHGDEGYELRVTTEDDYLRLEITDTGHTMIFRWTSELQDPHPVHISMGLSPVVRAVVEESDQLYMVILTSSGNVVDRFPLPQDE